MVFLCFSVSFLRPALLAGPVPVLSCLTVKWVWASARKKAFDCRSRQAKRSACPTRGWVKQLPRPCKYRRFQRSPRCGDSTLGLSCFFFRPPQSLKTGSLPLSGVQQGWDHLCFQSGHTGSTRPTVSSASPRYFPLRQSLTQPLTGGKDWLLRSRPWRSIPGALHPSPGACYILYCGAIFAGPAPRNPDPECDPEYRKPPWSGQERPSGFWGFQA